MITESAGKDRTIVMTSTALPSNSQVATTSRKRTPARLDLRTAITCPMCSSLLTPLEYPIESNGEQDVWWICPSTALMKCYFPVQLPPKIFWVRKTAEDRAVNYTPYPRIYDLPKPYWHYYPTLFQQKEEKKNMRTIYHERATSTHTLSEKTKYTLSEKTAGRDPIVLRKRTSKRTAADMSDSQTSSSGMSTAGSVSEWSCSTVESLSQSEFDELITEVEVDLHEDLLSKVPNEALPAVRGRVNAITTKLINALLKSDNPDIVNFSDNTLLTLVAKSYERVCRQVVKRKTRRTSRGPNYPEFTTVSRELLDKLNKNLVREEVKKRRGTEAFDGILPSLQIRAAKSASGVLEALGAGGMEDDTAAVTQLKKGVAHFEERVACCIRLLQEESRSRKRDRITKERELRKTGRKSAIAQRQSAPEENSNSTGEAQAGEPQEECNYHEDAKAKALVLKKMEERRQRKVNEMLISASASASMVPSPAPMTPEFLPTSTADMELLVFDSASGVSMTPAPHMEPSFYETTSGAFMTSAPNMEPLFYDNTLATPTTMMEPSFHESTVAPEPLEPVHEDQYNADPSHYDELGFDFFDDM